MLEKTGPYLDLTSRRRYVCHGCDLFICIPLQVVGGDQLCMPFFFTYRPGYQIFIYDCLQDVMFANNFFWTRSTLIYLWAILHHRLFFPAQLDSNLGNRVTKFGYNNKGSPLFEKRYELLFG